MSTPSPNLGACGRVLNEQTEEICNKPAVAEVLVRTKFGLMIVRLCQGDYAEHRAFYEELNKRFPKRKRNQRTYQPKSTPANISPHSTPGSQNGNRPALHQPGGR